jgi:hydroxysqualene dehydroxylase
VTHTLADAPGDQPRVAVVGAGWAGIAAALELTRNGHRVVLFESAKQPGGRARRVVWQGTPVDNGQHLLVGAYRETLALLETVGVSTGSALLRMPMRIDVPGRMSMRLPGLPRPLHLAVGLFSARGVTLSEKVAAALFIRRLQARQFRLRRDRPVAEWLDGHGQQGALREHLWDALCVAALNTRPKEASAQVFANVLRDTLGGAREATDFLLPRLDLGALLPDAALGFLARAGAQIRCPERVGSVRPDGATWIVASEHSEESFEHVVVASGAQHVAALLPEDRRLDRLRTMLERFAYEPIGTAYLRYPPGCRLPSPILALNCEPAQWVVDRGHLSDAADGLLAHVLSARGPWEALGDEALTTVLDQRTREALPACRAWPAPIDHLVIREKRATFRCTPDLERPPTATALPGLWLAGDYVRGDYPGTLESAVISGKAAAAAILKN